MQMTLAEEQFIFDDRKQLTQPGQLCGEVKDMAQKLLNHYVRVQGQTISQVGQGNSLMLEVILYPRWVRERV
jgi:hypothetical protein